MFLHEENVVVEDEMCAVSSKEMCFVCFDSLLAHFVGKELPKASVSGYPNHLCKAFCFHMKQPFIRHLGEVRRWHLKNARLHRYTYRYATL